MMVRCPHCQTPFEIAVTRTYDDDPMRGFNRHTEKCQNMPDPDRAYYKRERTWPRKRVRKMVRASL